MPSVCILCIRPRLKRFNSKISFHVFPTCPKKRQIWIKSCKLTNQEVLPRHKICSFHFKPTCFKVDAKRRILHSDAVPTIFEKRYVKKSNLPNKIVKERTKDSKKKKETGLQNQQSHNISSTKATKKKVVGPKGIISNLEDARDVFKHLQNIATNQKKKINNLDKTIKKLEDKKSYFMSQLKLANVKIPMVDQIKK
ncbi:THAP domain-containing protein 2-like [Rhopalosiphum maidis]|uniref:THAP domain-containing protein 2-like n=1 Tax=Rhopalosiphum maidis TaxID=43146 RepID=UPI000F00793E|nr:THAP domain-containing protein 2-like [Rhopalosiphum maidis]